jgi:hypothetical protein
MVPPQLKDLPRDMNLDIACRECGAHWSESVRHVVEARRMGAEYADLLEWKLRCECDGLVRVTFPAEAALRVPEAPKVSSAPVAVARMPYPVKAVVKPRGAGPAPVTRPLAAFPH